MSPSCCAPRAGTRRAKRLQRDALPRLEELTGPDSLATVRAVRNLAALYWSSGKLEQAESLALRAETAFHDLPAATQADRSANRQILASIYLTQHRYADAENLLHGTLEDGDTANSVMAYSNLAAAALGVRDNAKAEEYSRRALEVALRASARAASAARRVAQQPGPGVPLPGQVSGGRELLSTGDRDLGGRAGSAASRPCARGMMNLAAFYHERGREAGAEDLYARAAAILEQSLGRQNAEALVARNELADVLRAERRYTEAEKLSRATLGAMQSAFPAGDPRLERAQVNYVRLMEDTNRLAQGKKVKVQTLR